MASDDAWNTTYYQRAIRTRIGETLRAQYDRERSPMPHRLFTLLMQLNESAGTDEEKAAMDGADSIAEAASHRRRA